VCLALALHPFITYPLSLRLLAASRQFPAATGPVPKRIAVCVCAYNEAAVIAARVENILAARTQYPDLDVLFYVDAATDGTAEILRTYGDRIKLFVSPTRHGKTYGMNTLVGMTDADIVVFSDANVLFAPDAISLLTARFADARVGCVCGHLLYTQPGQALTTATAQTGSLYWRLEEHIKRLESLTGSVMGADGSIFAIRRSLHEAPPPDLIDDMYVSFATMFSGSRIVQAADAIAYEQAVSSPAEEFRRKVRISCQAFNVNRALWSRLMQTSLLDRYKYISHKLLRWLSIYLLAAAVLFGVAGVVTTGDLVLSGAVVFALVAVSSVVWLVRDGIVGKLREVLGAFIATGLGVAKSIRGERFQTWNPPASSRHPVAPTFFAAGE
jgi:cellulose synthase/poly-beta-1,6-N-acetylglucosamine synthase-like glycosyltransferase